MPYSSKILFSYKTMALGSAVVTAPILDLRQTPTLITSLKDPLQESQLLFGELVHILAVKDEWAYVQAPSQPYFCKEKGWIGYPGWVLKEHLSEENSPTHVVQTIRGEVFERPSAFSPLIT